MIRIALISIAVAFLSACTTLPLPVSKPADATSKDAVAVLRRSSEKAGNPWSRFRTVRVGYSGEWSRFVVKVQPVLTDPAFRKSSSELYEPKSARITQVHTGPAGEKIVVCTRGNTTVQRNRNPDFDTDSVAAAGLVADAYTVFTFGSSVLLARGSDWRILGEQNLAGEKCTLVAGTMKPGFGPSEQDAVIAWIGTQTHRMHRFQFTLNGLASTAGADVDVTFSDFQPGPNATEWPRHFIERVRRPFDVQAHDWRMTSLEVVR